MENDKLLQLWEQTIAASLVKNIISPVLSTSTLTQGDPAVVASQAILADTFNVNKFQSAISPSTLAKNDPLVMLAQQTPYGQQSILDSLSKNTQGFPTITAQTSLANDPLVAASFQPMVDAGQISPQAQLQNAPFGYSKDNPYSQKQSETTLLFRGADAPANLIPPEGNLGSTDFYGGNLYTPVGNNPLSKYAPIASAMPDSSVNSVDVFALAQYARNIAMEFGVIQRPGDTSAQRMQGIAKGAAFVASQFLLTTFNPADPQNGGLLNLLWNPASFLTALVPGLRGQAIGSINVPAVASVDGKAYQQNAAKCGDALDRHLLMRQGLYAKTTNASDIANGTLINYPGFIGDLSKAGTTDMVGQKKIPLVDGVTIVGQVDQDGIMGKAAQNGPYHVNLYDNENTYSKAPAIDNAWIEQQLISDPTQDPQQLILKRLFKPNKNNEIQWYSLRNLLPSIDGGPVAAAPTSYPSVVDAAFDGEDVNGLVNEDNAIPDDHNYMPFTFQDLRDTFSSLLYFRAFLKDGLSENFQPNWHSEGYYGRTDEVPTYINTIRTLQVGFDVVAWHPKDLPVIWTKLTKLQSMVYPTYDSNRYLQAGPLIRMRIGDLFSSHKDGNKKKGLPGYISSLAFDYDDNIWNITEDLKIPRKISVTLSFVVVHDGNPGLYLDDFGNSIFGTLEFASSPPPNQTSLASALINNAPSPIPSANPTLGDPKAGGIRGIVDTIADGNKNPSTSLLSKAAKVAGVP